MLFPPVQAISHFNVLKKEHGYSNQNLNILTAIFSFDIMTWVNKWSAF